MEVADTRGGQPRVGGIDGQRVQVARVERDGGVPGRGPGTAAMWAKRFQIGSFTTLGSGLRIVAASGGNRMALTTLALAAVTMFGVRQFPYNNQRPVGSVTATSCAFFASTLS